VGYAGADARVADTDGEVGELLSEPIGAAAAKQTGVEIGGAAGVCGRVVKAVGGRSGEIAGVRGYFEEPGEPDLPRTGRPCGGSSDAATPWRTLSIPLDGRADTEGAGGGPHRERTTGDCACGDQRVA